MIQNALGISRLPIGGQTHELILTRIHLETSIIGESGVEQTQRMGKVDLLNEFQCRASTHADRCGAPFTYAVHCQYRSAFERRWVISACGMRLMMLGKQERTIPEIAAGEGSDSFF